MDVYSTELTRMYLAACSEIDVVAKQLTKKIDQHAEAHIIDHYRAVIPVRYPNFCNFPVSVRRLGSSLAPRKDWDVRNQQWWNSYNKVKHRRHLFYKEANLRNVLHSVCGLFVLIFYFYHEAFQKRDIDPATMTALAWDESLGGRLTFFPPAVSSVVKIRKSPDPVNTYLSLSLTELLQ